MLSPLLNLTILNHKFQECKDTLVYCIPRYRTQDMHIVSSQTNIVVSRYTFTTANRNRG